MARVAPQRALLALATCALAVGAGAGCGAGEPGVTAAPATATTAPVTAPAATSPATAAATTAPARAATAAAAPVAAPAKAAGATTPAKAATSAKPAKAARPAAAVDDAEGDALPDTTPLSLPPILTASAGRSAAAPQWLRNRILRARGLVLAPAARQAVDGGSAQTGALLALQRIAAGRHRGPLLVHRVADAEFEVQATTQIDARAVLLVLRAGPDRAVERSLRLRPVAASFTDEAAGSAEAQASGGIGAQAVTFALKWLGTPYSWGGGDASGPTYGACGPAGCQGVHTLGFDCSGLVLYAYAQVGITLDHYAAYQFLEGRRIAPRDLLPGDLVFFHPKADGPGHVGMYIGQGQFVEAPHTGAFVRVSNLADHMAGYMGAVRPY